MPIVEGRMYPELHPKLFRHHTLTIGVIGLESDYIDLRRDLRVLESYAANTLESDIHVKLKFISSIDEVEKDVKDSDIDLLLDSKSEISKDQSHILSRTALVVLNQNDLKNQIEAFLVGNGVFWLFEEPVWNSPPLLRCIRKSGVSKNIHDAFINYQNSRDPDPKIVGRFRMLVNKTNSAMLCRDYLDFVLQSRRKSRRREFNEQQTYHDEINYHLTNYYFLLASSFDIIARLLNEKYSLGLTKYSELAVEKKVFIKELKGKSDSHAIFSEKDNNAWISWLKRRRNFVAHDGAISHTELVSDNPDKLSDDELERVVDEQADWNFIRSVFGENLYHEHRQLVMNIIKHKNSYKVEKEDIMVVDSNGKEELFFPLLSIGYDFEKFSTIMNEFIDAEK